MLIHKEEYHVIYFQNEKQYAKCTAHYEPQNKDSRRVSISYSCNIEKKTSLLYFASSPIWLAAKKTRKSDLGGNFNKLQTSEVKAKKAEGLKRLQSADLLTS